MTDGIANGWEPSPQKMGNWRAMFETGGARGVGPDASPGLIGTPHSPDVVADRDDGPDPLALDTAEYRPWILQRGRSRPAMMLHLRRFEPKSGQWLGWQLAYHSLLAVEYVGDAMLTLDFGARQFVIEGYRLSELVDHLQSGVLLCVQEYAASVWSAAPTGAAISRIRLLAPGNA